MKKKFNNYRREKLINKENSKFIHGSADQEKNFRQRLEPKNNKP